MGWVVGCWLGCWVVELLLVLIASPGAGSEAGAAIGFCCCCWCGRESLMCCNDARETVGEW